MILLAEALGGRSAWTQSEPGERVLPHTEEEDPLCSKRGRRCFKMYATKAIAVLSDPRPRYLEVDGTSLFSAARMDGGSNSL